MIQGCFRLGPHRGGPPADGRADIDWARQLSSLSGLCEEYQSSLIALPHLRAAIRRKPGLAPVLQSPLVEMQDAHRSLRYEVLGVLDDFAALVGSVGAPQGDDR